MKPGPKTPEARAKAAARLRAMWAGEWGEKRRRTPNQRRPPVGTEEHRKFVKVALVVGAAAAHAELRRGDP